MAYHFFLFDVFPFNTLLLSSSIVMNRHFNGLDRKLSGCYQLLVWGYRQRTYWILYTTKKTRYIAMWIITLLPAHLYFQLATNANNKILVCAQFIPVDRVISEWIINFYKPNSFNTQLQSGMTQFSGYGNVANMLVLLQYGCFGLSS